MRIRIHLTKNKKILLDLLISCNSLLDEQKQSCLSLVISSMCILVLVTNAELHLFD